MGRHKSFDRTEVIEKAMRLFWKKGFAETSLKDLEKATGVFKSGLYSEFKDKDDLYLHTVEHYKSKNPALLALTKLPLGWHNIQEFLRISIVSEGQRGCFLANSVSELDTLPKKLREIINESTASCNQEFIKNFKAAGVKKDVEFAIELITTFQYGLSIRVNLDTAKNIEKQIERFIEHLQSTMK